MNIYLSIYLNLGQNGKLDEVRNSYYETYPNLHYPVFFLNYYIQKGTKNDLMTIIHIDIDSCLDNNLDVFLISFFVYWHINLSR